MAFRNRFVGRERKLKELHSAWEKTTRLFTIYGMRSIGKSRLAEQFIQDIKNHSHNVEEIWVDLKFCKEIRHIFVPLLEHLHLKDDGHNSRLLAEKAISSISKLQQYFVIVYDNAEHLVDSDLCTEFLDICQIFLMQTQNVKIIITTSSIIEELKTLTEESEQVLMTEVLPLSNTESKELLRTAAPTVDFGPYMDEIVRHCEGLPLALLLTASELAPEDAIITPEEITQLFVTRRLEVLSPIFYPRDDQIAPKYRDFLLRLSVHLQDGLAVLNYFPASFNLHQAQTIMGHTSLDETYNVTLEPAVQRCVVQYDSKRMRYDIHGILRECVEEYLKIKNLPAIRKRFCFMFSKMLQEMQIKLDSKHYREALCCFNFEHQNFQKLFTEVRYSTEDTYGMFIEVAKSATENTLHRFFGVSGFSFYEECLKLTQKYCRDIDRACVHISYGSALTNMKGNYVDGEMNYRIAFDLLEIRPTESRGYHMAEVCQRLGWNLGYQGKTTEAIQFLHKAFDVETALLPRLHVLVLQTLSCLGIFYTDIGDLDNGERFHFEVLKRRREKFGTDDHPHIGSTMNNIGLLYKKGDNFNEAFKYFSNALRIKQSTNAPDKAIVISQCNVATCLSMLKRHQEALYLLQEAENLLAKYPKLYDDMHARVLEVRGKIYINLEDYPQAWKCFNDAMKIRKDISPSSFPVAENLLQMAKCSNKMGDIVQRVSDLENAYKISLKIKKECPRHMSILECCKMFMDVSISLSDKHHVQYYYDKGHSECSRLLQVFEEVEDKPSLLKVKDIQKQMKEQILKFQNFGNSQILKQTSSKFRYIFALVIFVAVTFCLVLYLSLDS